MTDGQEGGRAMRDALRVLVHARYPLVRAGLSALLEEAGIGVSDDAGALDGLAVANVDAAVVDLAGDEDDDSALGAVEAAGLPAVVLVDRLPRDALEGGSPRAWVARDAGREELAAAVRSVAVGMLVIDPVLLRARALEAEAEPGVGQSPLTEREREVLGLVSVGLPNKAIALRLGISEHTVKFHVASLLSKLDAHSRAEAVAIATRQGLLRL